MSVVEVGLSGAAHGFLPGETLTGKARWQLERAPQRVVVRLFWRSGSKGSVDLKVVDEVTFDRLEASDSRSYSFTLPASPYSFTGTLVSLSWAIEVVAEPGDLSDLTEIVLGPHRRAITLPSLTDP